MEGFGRAKKELIMLIWPIFGIFWCLVVTLVPFSSNLRNFERNQKKLKNPKKIKKISKNPKFQKSPKNPKKNVLRFFFLPKKKNAFPLVLPIEEISLPPELSSPLRFRIQGGWSERYEGKDGNSCV